MPVNLQHHPPNQAGMHRAWSATTTTTTTATAAAAVPVDEQRTSTAVTAVGPQVRQERAYPDQPPLTGLDFLDDKHGFFFPK